MRDLRSGEYLSNCIILQHSISGQIENNLNRLCDQSVPRRGPNDRQDSFLALRIIRRMFDVPGCQKAQDTLLTAARWKFFADQYFNLFLGHSRRVLLMRIATNFRTSCEADKAEKANKHKIPFDCHNVLL